MGFCMALSMNSVGIPGGFRGNAGFSRKLGGFGVVSGDLGGQKAFCANSHLFIVTGASGKLGGRQTCNN